jgi:hypothetical protein
MALTPEEEPLTTEKAETVTDDSTPPADPYVGVSRPFPMGSRAPKQEH